MTVSFFFLKPNLFSQRLSQLYKLLDDGVVDFHHSWDRELERSIAKIKNESRFIEPVLWFRNFFSAIRVIKIRASLRYSAFGLSDLAKSDYVNLSGFLS